MFLLIFKELPYCLEGFFSFLTLIFRDFQLNHYAFGFEGTVDGCFFSLFLVCLLWLVSYPFFHLDYCFKAKSTNFGCFIFEGSSQKIWVFAGYFYLHSNLFRFQKSFFVCLLFESFIKPIGYIIPSGLQRFVKV